VRRCTQSWQDRRFVLEQETNAYAVLPAKQWRGYRPPAEAPAPAAGTWAIALSSCKDYVRALAETMGAEDRRFFKGRVLDRARGVASSADGFLGIGKVSTHEQKVLDELASAFSGLIADSSNTRGGPRPSVGPCCNRRADDPAHCADLRLRLFGRWPADPQNGS
jgi:hypothetical protein